MHEQIKAIAKAARLGDLAAINAELDVIQARYNGFGRAVIDGRGLADRSSGRTPPLPPLSFDQMGEFRSKAAA